MLETAVVLGVCAAAGAAGAAGNQYYQKKKHAKDERLIIEADCQLDSNPPEHHPGRYVVNSTNPALPNHLSSQSNIYHQPLVHPVPVYSPQPQELIPPPLPPKPLHLSQSIHQYGSQSFEQRPLSMSQQQQTMPMQHLPQQQQQNEQYNSSLRNSFSAQPQQTLSMPQQLHQQHEQYNSSLRNSFSAQTQQPLSMSQQFQQQQVSMPQQQVVYLQPIIVSDPSQIPATHQPALQQTPTYFQTSSPSQQYILSDQVPNPQYHSNPSPQVMYVYQSPQSAPHSPSYYKN